MPVKGRIMLNHGSRMNAWACHAKSEDFARIGEETRKSVPGETDFLTGRYSFPVEIAGDFFVGIHMHRQSRYMWLKMV